MANRRPMLYVEPPRQFGGPLLGRHARPGQHSPVRQVRLPAQVTGTDSYRLVHSRAHQAG